MIHLRKNAFSEESIEIEFQDGEPISALVDRVILTNGYALDGSLDDHFQVLINGVAVEKDLWTYIKIKESDDVLVAPRLSGGEGGQLFKQIAIIAITVAAAYFLGPGGLALGNAAFAVSMAAVGIVTTLGLNALIPPPELPGLGGLGSNGASFEGSQMYTITGQANSAKKFGYVPQVYGTHRIFPIIAANPYTEIEAEKQTGKLVQYYYAIYDFGFGPLAIEDIKIGDTFIEDYSDASYRFVDLNKPAISEGTWDDVLHEDFKYYKGDVERDGTAIALDRNQNDVIGSTAGVNPIQAILVVGQNTISIPKKIISSVLTVMTSPLSTGMKVSGVGIPADTTLTSIGDDYIVINKLATENGPSTLSFTSVGDFQAVRYASANVNGSKQEISIDFVCPQGLVAYGTDGVAKDRFIEIRVEFSKIGENIWKLYNDENYVYPGHSFAGGLTDFTNRAATVISPDSGIYRFVRIHPTGNLSNSLGYPAGTTRILMLTGTAGLGEILYDNAGQPLGNIIAVEESLPSDYNTTGGVAYSNVYRKPYNDPSVYTRYSWVTLESPLTVPLVVFKFAFNVIGAVGQIYLPPTLGANPILGIDLTNRISVQSRGAIQLTGKTSTAIYSTFKFSPIEISQFKVRITRVNTSSSVTYRTFDKLTLMSVSTRFDRQPIITDKRHVFLEVRIRATNQLNGSITNLSAVASSVLDVWDGSAWVKQVTNNPAWVFCDLITGKLNKRALDKSRLHLPSIIEWANFCDAIPTSPPSQTFEDKRFTTNFVLDFDTTLQSILNTVNSAAQASLNIIDGKYGVLIDRLKTVPVQIFTPRNSWGFSSTRNYSDTPHALKIKYIDPDKSWDVSEVSVYDNGYTEETATKTDELSSFACTSYEQAWRFGRYMLAQARLRKEVINIQVDFEYLVCTRGDYVQVTQDVMKSGGTPARVKLVVGDLVTIDDSIDTIFGENYGYVYRSITGEIKTSTLTVISSDEFELDGDIPQVGDLIIIGVVGSIALDCIVKSITPSSDLSASLTLCEKADGVHLAESTDVLPDYDPRLNQNVDSSLMTPPVVEDLVVTSNSWRVVSNTYQHYIGLDWEAPSGAAYDKFEVYVNSGGGFNLVSIINDSFYEYIVDNNNLGTEHIFKVLAVSATGKKLTLFDAPSVSATPLLKVTPPSDVPGLFLNITNQVLQLDWNQISDSDVKEYLIRYSSNTATATWETSIPLQKVDKNTDSIATQGRTGTYFIKAIDLNGNQSTNSAEARTTIPNLFDLNVIAETNDFPALEGDLDTVESDGTALTLKRIIAGGVETNLYYSEGFYNYRDFLDLGEIYTVRLQSQIEAEGFTIGDIMSEWYSLDTLLAMSGAGNADWDVETYWRATDRLNVISEWNTLTEIDPISEGDPDNWSAWKKFTIGDVTGRIFQFKLKLISNKASVTPRVFNGVVKADMPDRLESYNNLVSLEEGTTVFYSTPFKGPGSTPNIQISQDNASSGDYYILENKTLNGFTIKFYDKTNVAVSRQFDVSVKGYGRKSVAVI